MNFKVFQRKAFSDSVILWHGKVTVESNLCHECSTVYLCEASPCTVSGAVARAEDLTEFQALLCAPGAHSQPCCGWEHRCSLESLHLVNDPFVERIRV